MALAVFVGHLHAQLVECAVGAGGSIALGKVSLHGQRSGLEFGIMLGGEAPVIGLKVVGRGTAAQPGDHEHDVQAAQAFRLRTGGGLRRRGGKHRYGSQCGCDPVSSHR